MIIGHEEKKNTSRSNNCHLHVVWHFLEYKLLENEKEKKNIKEGEKISLPVITNLYAFNSSSFLSAHVSYQQYTKRNFNERKH